MNIQFKNSNFFDIKHPLMGISFYNWAKLLRKNGFKFHRGYLPKILFLTVNSIINLPVQGFEYARFGAKINRQKIVKPVFILGHPRSGTTYLHFVLSKDPGLAYCTTYEALIPNIFLTGGKLLKSLIAPAMPEHRPQDKMKIEIDSPMEEEFAMANISQTSFMHGFYFPEGMAENFSESVVFEKDAKKNAAHWKRHFHFFLKKLTYKYPGRTLLLKSPANTGRLKEIYELFPDARFIHIHRNPYDVYLSTERLYERILPLTAFQKVDSEKVKSYIIDAYEKMYRKYLEDKKGVPENQLFEMRYDDFIDAPVAQLQKVYDHLKMEGFEEAVAHFRKEIKNAKNYRPNAYDAISDDVKFKIKEQWKFAFEAFGYGGNL